MKKKFRKVLAVGMAAAMVIGSFQGFGSLGDVVALGETPAISLTSSEIASAYAETSPSRVSVHDPSIIKDTDGTYYIFGSHMACAKSTDLVNWTSFTTNINTNFSTLFANEIAWSAAGDSVYDPSGNMWAPDVVYNTEMGKWTMYMSINGCSWNSSIAMLSADSLMGPWSYEGTVVYSGFTDASNNHSISNTDFTLATGETILPARYIMNAYTCKDGNTATATTTWNYRYGAHAIDPCVFYGEDGNLYMSYGSWSGGIYIIELDEATGLRDYNVTYPTVDNTSDAYMGTKLAGGFSASGEASYIEYIDGYYYLFISNGGFIASGGYNMRVYRSSNPEGPYLDVSGESPKYTGGTSNTNSSVGTRIMSYYKWDYQKYAQVAQGHNSAMYDADLDKAFVVYHTRTNDGTEGHSVRVHQLFTTENGYLVAAPFEYNGETVSATGYTTEEVAGTYEVILQKQGVDYSNLEYCGSDETTLNADGTISGAYTGTWSMTSGTPYCTLVIGGITYEGVFTPQTIEGTDIDTMAFTIVGTNDICIWGAQYPSDQVAIAMTSDSLSVAGETYGDVTLSTEGIFGATVAWTSDNTAVIANDGKVTVPEEDTNVTLTATVTSGNYVYEKTFTVLVHKAINYDEMQLLASYFTNDPQDLSSKLDGSLTFANPYYTTEGLDLSQGLKIKFDLSAPTGTVNALSTVLAFSANNGDAGRMYFTSGSYLGYNATGGFFDANIQNWVPVTNYILAGGTVEIDMDSDGFDVYVDGVKKFDETYTVSPNGGNDFIGGYYNVLSWLKNTADTISFGKGGWWDHIANVDISNVEFYGYILEPEDDSAHTYQQTYNWADAVGTYWTSPNLPGGLAISNNGDDHKQFAQFATTTNNSRSAYSILPEAANLSGKYTVSVDANLTAGTNQTTNFAIMGTDGAYAANAAITGGYLLKLATLNSTVWTINDDATKTVNIPVGTWVNIDMNVDTDAGEAFVVITNEDTGAVLYSDYVTMNGTGVLGGIYVLGGRYQSVTKVDNIIVDKVVTPPTSLNDKVGTDKTASFWSLFSNYYKLEGDVDLTFDIDVVGDVTNYTNFATAITTAAERGAEGYSEYMIMRADNFGWCVNAPDMNGDEVTGDPNFTAEGVAVDYTQPEDWSAFAATISDSNVEMRVQRTGNDFVLTYNIHGNNGTELVTSASFTTAADDTLYLFMIAEKSYFTVNSVVSNIVVPEETTEATTSETATTEKTTETTTAKETTAKATTTVKETTTEKTTSEEETTTFTKTAPEKVTKTPVAGTDTNTEALNQVKTSTEKTVEVAAEEGGNLSGDFFKEIKDNSKNAIINVVNEDNEVMYSWSFAGDKITDTDKEIDLSIAMDTDKSEAIQELTNNADALFMEFAYHGELPGPATIKMYVGDKYANGETVYLYYYDEEADEVLKVGETGLEVKEGYVEFTITHCSVYFVSVDVISADLDTTSVADVTESVITDGTETGDNSNVIIYVSLSVLLMGLYVGLSMKKKKVFSK